MIYFAATKIKCGNFLVSIHRYIKLVAFPTAFRVFEVYLESTDNLVFAQNGLTTPLVVVGQALEKFQTLLGFKFMAL